jgi:hypothetical protein
MLALEKNFFKLKVLKIVRGAEVVGFMRNHENS